MSREAHVRFYEGLGVRLPGATHPVIHCQSAGQARLVLGKLGERLRECGLELHPEKTRIVYCQDVNRREAYPTNHFTFLGYMFRPRKAVDKYGRVYVNFSPGVSREALERMRQTVRGWHLQLMPDGAETFVETSERLFGALDAAEIPIPCARHVARSSVGW